MLLFSVFLNHFIVLVVFALALWGVYVLLFVGNRQQKKQKRPMPTGYTFFQPTAPGANGKSFEVTVPLSHVNLDELRLGITDPATTLPTTPPPLPTTSPVAIDDSIADDNPDFAILEDDEVLQEDTLAKPRQVMMVQATAVPVDFTDATPTFTMPSIPMLDEDVLNQVEAIFGNEDQMALLDQYHTEANRVMLLTGEDYHTVFHRLIQDETPENQTYLTSMLIPADSPEPVFSMATVLAMGDEEAVSY